MNLPGIERTSTGPSCAVSWLTGSDSRSPTSRSWPAGIGGSDGETQRDLRAALESFANKRDPDDPSKTYEALTIQYLSGEGKAVTDACYRDAGGRALDDLGNVAAPDPDAD
jgi:hypothetical protein